MAGFRAQARVVGYVLSGVAAGIALVISCSDGPPKGQAQTTGAGANGGNSNGGTANGGSSGGSIQCSPGSFFCNGNVLWQCTLSGSDGSNPTDCSTGGSVTNPSACQTSGCSGDGGACCLRSAPNCAWNLTAPLVTSGSTDNLPAGVYCEAPALQACAGSPFTVLFEDTGACPTSLVEVSIKRGSGEPDSGTAAPGSTLTLPDSAVNLVVGGCSTWSGTVDWVSDVPSWQVDIDATCANPGDAGITVVGTLSGTS